jgi:ribonuclease HI
MVGRRNAGVEPIKNRLRIDACGRQFDELRSDKYIEVEKVRAHSGVRANEIADSLAVDAARSNID